MKKGFSLPLWVASAAKSAVKKLLGLPYENYEFIKIPNETKSIKIKVHSASLINGNSYAMAISFVESGLHLDLTNNLEIWTIVSFEKLSIDNNESNNIIDIIAGDGVGIYEKSAEICISNFAKEILFENLLNLIPKGFKLNLEIIFPNGKFLAERTSNKSFGIVEGLSIIGTSAETYSSAAPDQLLNAKNQLKKIVQEKNKSTIVFVIGENGYNLAESCKVQFPIVKVGNWIGPLLVEAAIKNVKTVILFGYHGKLIKLAGGIFHTHNHLADGRIEILVYLAVREKVPIEIITKLSQSNSIEEGLILLENFSKDIANKLWTQMSNKIENRSFKYVNRYTKTDMQIAAIIFDRNRKIRWFGDIAKEYISFFENN